MAYRQALLMVGDPMYARARAGAMVGDPFLGGLIGGAVRAIGGIARSGVGRAIGKAVGLARRGIRRAPIATTTTVGGLALELGKARGKRAALEGLRVGGRRMNVTNPKALRRAIRRVTGFGKTVKRAKSAVSKAASAMGIRRSTTKKAFGRRR